MNFTVIVKSYEAAVEQQISIGRQQESIHPIQALLGSLTRPPRLDVTGYQKRWISDLGEPTSGFHALNIGPKPTLPATGLDDGLLCCGV